jgi:16S rRNA (uracil1498-N3)-methyltransferase
MSLPVHLAPSLHGVRTGDAVEVSGDEAHHAVAVRRLRVGEEVALTDGRGTRAVARVTSTGKRAFSAEVLTLEHTDRPEPRLMVVQALPKGDRGELAVEVLTEVGVDTIVPWAAARSVAVWRGERADKGHARWSATAREAAKQSRRSWFPEVLALHDTSSVTELVGTADLVLVLHEEGADPLVDVAVPATGTLALVVGPEGGLAPEELEAFAAAGARVVRLGDEVLRTSTAGVAAVAALLSRTARWS